MAAFYRQHLYMATMPSWLEKMADAIEQELGSQSKTTDADLLFAVAEAIWKLPADLCARDVDLVLLGGRGERSGGAGG